MESIASRLRRSLPAFTAITLVAVLYILSRQPVISGEDAADLARRFRFEQIPLPKVAGLSYERNVRIVQPSLNPIRSWISFVGAGVAAADLDGDGLPNDLVHVDPRVDAVVIMPAPGTSQRFSPFVLEPKPLPFNRRSMAPMGSRVGDFNEDGYADVLVYYWGRSPILFLQQAGSAPHAAVSLNASSFIPRELAEPVQIWFTSAVAQADFDGDGHLDLFVGNYSPDHSHVLDPAAPGIEEMMHSMSRASNGGTDHILLWQQPDSGSLPGARFRDVAGILDHDVAGGWTFAIAASDLDGDLLPEIYLAQDFGPDRLLHNRSTPGHPRFTLLRGQRSFTTPRSLVPGADSFSGMGVDVGDLNDDGMPDIFVSNISCDYGIHESNFVFLNTGNSEAMLKEIAPFRNASEELGLSRSGWTWDVKLADFDNDGVLEIMQAAGFTKGTVNRWPELHELSLGNDELIPDPRFYHPIQPGDDVAGLDHNPFFVRTRTLRYADIALQVGLGTPMLSRGFSPADFDGDGRIDFAVANNWEDSFVFHNRAPDPGSFLGLHLRVPLAIDENIQTTVRPGHPQRWSEGPTRPAIGTAVTVQLAGGRRLVAEVDGGNGHSGQRAPDLHFGIGKPDATKPLKVDVRWRARDGRVVEKSFSLLPDRWYTIVLGAGAPTQEANER